MIGRSSMWNKHSRTLLKIKASRLFRGAVHDVKRKVSKGNAGTPESLVNGTILPPEKANREKKYKSTLAVAVAGTAIGVSHVAAVSGKYRTSMSGKATLSVGLTVGMLTAGVWYKYIDAAYDGVTEEDISMMFEMANSTGYGSLDDDDDNSKAVDILHTLVTGKVSEGGGKSESMFKYDDDDEEDDDDDDDDNVFTKKVSFSDPNTKSSTSKKSGFGSGGIGKTLSKGKEFSRKSFLPDLDREEAEEGPKEVQDGWMDFS